MFMLCLKVLELFALFKNLRFIPEQQDRCKTDYFVRYWIFERDGLTLGNYFWYFYSYFVRVLRLHSL